MPVMVATARKPKLAAGGKALPVSRADEDAYFDALRAPSAEWRRRHESHDQRLERANREQYARWSAWQDAMERGVSGNVKRTKTKLSRIEKEEKLYIDYRTRNPRARSWVIQSYLRDALKISKSTLDRDLKRLRAQRRIPSYHRVPFIPPK